MFQAAAAGAVSAMPSNMPKTTTPTRSVRRAADLIPPTAFVLRVTAAMPPLDLTAFLAARRTLRLSRRWKRSAAGGGSALGSSAATHSKGTPEVVRLPEICVMLGLIPLARVPSHFQCLGRQHPGPNRARHFGG